MAAELDIRERSFLPIAFEFRDSRGIARVPDTVHYKLVCTTTDTVLVDWTALTPAASIDLEIGASLNRILDDANRAEEKELTVEANQDTERAHNNVFLYRVLNGRARS